MRHGHKNSRENGPAEQSSEDRLQEDCILNLSKGRLLDPQLAIKDFTYNIASLVLGNPWLVFVAVCGVARVKGGQRLLGTELDAVVLIVAKHFPWAEVTMMHTVKDDAHPLDRGD